MHSVLPLAESGSGQQQDAAVDERAAVPAFAGLSLALLGLGAPLLVSLPESRIGATLAHNPEQEPGLADRQLICPKYWLNQAEHSGDCRSRNGVIPAGGCCVPMYGPQ